MTELLRLPFHFLGMTDKEIDQIRPLQMFEWWWKSYDVLTDRIIRLEKEYWTELVKGRPAFVLPNEVLRDPETLMVD